jgi:16S rRNA (cytosine967-C5)-methyltransferase
MEVLGEVEDRKRPVSEALKAWGLANRFAGAGDRAAIGNLVYDALRRRASHAWIMDSNAPRALILAVAVRDWGLEPEALNASFAEDAHAPEAHSETEIARLTAADLSTAPEAVLADVPDWLVPSLQGSFGADWIDECQGLATRPPLDLRVNQLKSTRDRVMKSLARFSPEATAIAPLGVRMDAGHGDSRTPNVQTDEGYLKGWFEVQDQGSQIVSILAGAEPGTQVLDYCAGAGGKTLALAASMDNRGQIFAFDGDRARLAPIYDRLKRNGVRNAQVRPPNPGALDDLKDKLDLVVVDAPCTGTGTWRRRPDTKWKLSPEQLAARVEDQREVLDGAAQFVKQGGALAYITCSVLPEENDGAITAFLERHPEFSIEPAQNVWRLPGKPRFSAIGGATLSPLSTATDGFYFARLRRG